MKARKVESEKSEKSDESVVLNDYPKYRNGVARDAGVKSGKQEKLKVGN